MATRYRDIANDIARRIIAGEFPVGAELPPRSALAEEYDCSRMTIQGAVRELSERGLVSSYQGKRAVVSAAPAAHGGADVEARLAAIESRLDTLIAALRQAGLRVR